MTRDEQTARIVSEAPESAKNTLTRAFSGNASPRAAIKAQCLTCTGFDRETIKNCTGFSCPLWAYRPFQAGTLTHQSPTDTEEHEETVG